MVGHASEVRSSCDHVQVFVAGVVAFFSQNQNDKTKRRQDDKITHWPNWHFGPFRETFPRRSSSVIKMLNARPDHAVDCKMNPWQSWSHCTKTCSGAVAVLMVVSWNPGNPNMSDSMRIPNERSLGNCLQVFQGTFLAEPQTKFIAEPGVWSDETCEKDDSLQ